MTEDKVLRLANDARKMEDPAATDASLTHPLFLLLLAGRKSKR